MSRHGRRFLPLVGLLDLRASYSAATRRRSWRQLLFCAVCYSNPARPLPFEVFNESSFNFFFLFHTEYLILVPFDQVGSRSQFLGLSNHVTFMLEYWFD